MSHFNDFKTFVEYSNNMNNVYKVLEENKCKILIAFDDMIADCLVIKNLSQ